MPVCVFRVQPVGILQAGGGGSNSPLIQGLRGETMSYFQRGGDLREAAELQWTGFLRPARKALD